MIVEIAGKGRKNCHFNPVSQMACECRWKCKADSNILPTGKFSSGVTKRRQTSVKTDALALLHQKVQVNLFLCFPVDILGKFSLIRL